jgi:hypothetical protein
MNTNINSLLLLLSTIFYLCSCGEESTSRVTEKIVETIPVEIVQQINIREQTRETQSCQCGEHSLSVNGDMVYDEKLTTKKSSGDVYSYTDFYAAVDSSTVTFTSVFYHGTVLAAVEYREVGLDQIDWSHYNKEKGWDEVSEVKFGEIQYLLTIELSDNQSSETSHDISYDCKTNTKKEEYNSEIYTAFRSSEGAQSFIKKCVQMRAK